MLRYILSKKTFQSWLWLFAILGIWELASRLNIVPSYFLPPFSRVVLNMFREITAGNLGMQALNSLVIILGGFILALVISIIVTLLSSWAKPVETLFSMLSTVFNPLPAIALMPLIIFWFGINTGAMLVIIIHAVLWALIRHLLDGIRAIPKVYYEWSDNIEMSPLRKFTDVLLFAILSELIAGIRVGWGRAWRALIGAEMIFGMIGTLGGIGYYIYQARAFAKIANVMSGVVIIIIIGVIFESILFNQLEKHTIKKWGMIRE
jgi:NitT/TauT family transport system permease protein